MKRKILFLGIGLVFISIFSCGIFTPKNVEQPGGNDFVDPFHFKSILNGTGGESFPKTSSYEDIFDDNFKFIAWDNVTYDRATEIERLKTLKASDTTISTVWDTCSGIGEIREDTSMILCRTFYITHSKADEKVTDTGKVEFKLTKSSVNMWTILLWKEGSAGSIFHP